MAKKPVLVGVIIFLALMGLIAYSTMSTAKARVEACVEFKGNTVCRTTAGETREEALHTAVSNACAVMVSGVTDSLACEHTPPSKVTWLK